ncbi:MAG: SEL1-like repeat protein, partial [Thermoguttaceae bacterium]|nr:SEL1-like repeat protein [Thermoguttaceae bacterium]
MKRFGKKFRRFAAAIGLALVVDLALPLIAESTTPFVVKFIGSLIGDLFKKDTPPYEPNVNSPVSSDGESRKLAQDPDSCFALFIGVDAYDSLPNLSYSSSDAKALRDAVLKLGFRNENVWLCVSDGSRRELPTKKNVDAALADMLAAAEEAGDDATIFISLSGHGFETPEGAAAFCPKDAVAAVSPGKPTTVTRESAVLVDDLMKKLREHRARFKMLIVDACRSPAQMKGNDAHERSFRIDNVPSGIAFLQSCGSGEASYEDAEFRRSVFTHYFIEGLEGKAENKDGGVTFFDLCGYAAQKTQARVETAYKGKQTPFFTFSGVNFVLKESTRSAADALYREGRALAWGLDGTKIDGFRALDLLSQAAEAGLTDAQAALAQLYYDGCEATPPDFKKAVEWANRAGENPIAQNVLGDCFLDGLAVSKDEAEAKRLHEAAFKRFQELAESGDPIILNLLARCCCNGSGTPVNFVEGAKYARLAAERCAVGVVNLGAVYANGLGVERDAAEATRLWNDAIELNCSFAYAYMGNYYTQGSELDFKRAVEYYRKAAEKNCAEGAAGLGYCYANGWGVEKKPKEAVRLYRQAFEWNSALGTFLLAESLLNGTGCEKNQREALKLFERAAEQDHWLAFSRVADCYENAWGTLKNEEYANEWRERLFLKYQEYAEAGASSSMNNLGDCYRNGA